MHGSPAAHVPQYRVLVRPAHHVGVGPAQIRDADPHPVLGHLGADGFAKASTPDLLAQ